MRYVIGDIHGEVDKLKSLLDIILAKGCCKLIFIGDYIDKGMYSMEVVQYLIELNKHMDCVFLKGNHEYMLLRAINGDDKAIEFMVKYGGIETLHSYLAGTLTRNIKYDIQQLKGTIPGSHLKFLNNLVPFYIDSKYIIIHAGINPQNPIMCETNGDLYFIRNVFIDSNKYILDNKRIVFGHTAFKFPFFDPYKIGIDTGAAYEEYGYLSAYNMDEGYCINHIGQVTGDPYFDKTGDDR